MNIIRKTAAAFEQTYCRKCVPCFIGVWDTVASLGYFLGKKFFDDDLHGKITYGYQAAAIDKKRPAQLQNMVLETLEVGLPENTGKRPCPSERPF